MSSENAGFQQNPARVAIDRAKREIAEEEIQKGVAKLKIKYRERASAETVLVNVNREIADLEAAIEQGNA